MNASAPCELSFVQGSILASEAASEGKWHPAAARKSIRSRSPSSSRKELVIIFLPGELPGLRSHVARCRHPAAGDRRQASSLMNLCITSTFLFEIASQGEA